MTLSKQSAQSAMKIHHRARLSNEQVDDMRQLYESWKKAGANKGYGWLALIFGCGASTARDIVTYRTR